MPCCYSCGLDFKDKPKLGNLTASKPNRCCPVPCARCRPTSFLHRRSSTHFLVFEGYLFERAVKGGKRIVVSHEKADLRHPRMLCCKTHQILYTLIQRRQRARNAPRWKGSHDLAFIPREDFTTWAEILSRNIYTCRQMPQLWLLSFYTA